MRRLKIGNVPGDRRNDPTSCVARGFRLEAIPVGAVPAYTIAEFPAGAKGEAEAVAALFEALETPAAAYTHFVVWKQLETLVACSPRERDIHAAAEQAAFLEAPGPVLEP